MIIIEGFETAKLALSRQVSTEFYEPPSELQHGFKDAAGADVELEVAVRQIIDEVRRRGDAALFDYELRFDGVELVSLEVGRAQVTKAYKEVAPELVESLKMAAERIRIFHSAQSESLMGVGARRFPDQLIRPLERVGIYAPGGTAAYPSTVLMTAIPAKVAGVKEILLATPPRTGGVVPPAVLVAAGGLRSENRLLRRAEHRNEAARVLEAAIESGRSGVLPLEDGDFGPAVPSGLDGLRVRIRVVPEDTTGLYRGTAVARWREDGRATVQRLDTMVWRP